MVTIKTLNGSFRFSVRKYALEGQVNTWINLTDPALGEHYESKLLEEYVLEQVRDVSYEKASKNAGKRMGNATISDMRIHEMVRAYATGSARKVML